MKGKTKMIGLMLIATILSLALFVSADTGNTGATLEITNAAPTIIEVVDVPSVTLISNSTKVINVAFNASDANGLADINITTGTVTLTKSGETTRVSDVPCDTSVNGTNWALFNCSVTLYYYDGAGSWNINATVYDNAGSLAVNDSTSVTVNSLDSIVLSLSTIDFGSASPGVSDVGGDDVGIYNLGNTDYTVINVKGYNLTSGANSIAVTNFCVNDADDANTGCDALVEDTDVQVTGLTLTAASEAMSTMYDFVDIPALQEAGSYSASSNWVITATA